VATFVAAARAVVVADLCIVVAGKCKSTVYGVPTTEVLEAHLVHFVKRKCVAFFHVGNKFAVNLLMTVRRRQVKSHEGDKGGDIGDRHGGHVVKLRDGFVYGSDVHGESRCGIVLESHAFFQATHKKFVRDGCAREWVDGEDTRPHVSVTGGQRAWVVGEHFKERAEVLSRVLERVPEPVIQNVLGAFTYAVTKARHMVMCIGFSSSVREAHSTIVIMMIQGNWSPREASS
jgi:hypothetical protein